MNIIAMMPAYKGDGRMLEAIAALKDKGFSRIVVINDGIDKAFAEYYAAAREMGCDIVEHAINLGKGAALRTGFNYVMLHYPDAAGIVTCDADGQHEPEAVYRTALLTEKYPDHMILACREFFQAKVPVKNLFGNTITRLTFRLICGLGFRDTQCGLRGFPMDVVKRIMQCYGDRFEYENTMLLELRRQHIGYVQMPINAVYEEKEKHTTHYNTLVDSYKIYSAISKYAALPIFAAVVSTFAAFFCRNLGLQALCQAMCVLLGWLLVSPAVPEDRFVKWLLSTAISTAVAFGLSFLLLSVTALPAFGVWWLMAIINAPLGYSLWQWTQYGKKPARIDVLPGSPVFTALFGEGEGSPAAQAYAAMEAQEAEVEDNQ